MSQVRTLLTGRGLLESPRWHGDQLFVSDWSVGEVLSVDRDGRIEVVTHLDAFPLCTDRLPDGRMLVVSSADGRLLRAEPNGTFLTHADLGRPGWNDIVVDGRGNAYVNHIGSFAVPDAGPAPGSVSLVTMDGVVRAVADDLAFPNGMAVTPDNTTLIIAESFRNRLLAFDIDAAGGLSHRRVWADLDDGAPDGICLDADGAVWYADVPNKRCTRVAPGGAILRAVDLDRGCFACTLGGPDRKTLFMVAAEWRGMSEMVSPGTGQVLAMEVAVPGAGWP